MCRETQFKAGNVVWQSRKTHGRPPRFANSEALRAECITYFEWCEANPLLKAELAKYRGKGKVFYLPQLRPFTITGMCAHLKISFQTWTTYGRKPEFADNVEWVQDVIYQQKFDGAAAGIFNASIIGREIRPMQ